MEVREILFKVNDISSKLKDLLKATDKSEIETLIQNINIEIEYLNKEEELKEFVTNLKKIINILATSPNQDVKNESFLHLLSIISSERSRIVEKYKFCSEPE